MRQSKKGKEEKATWMRVNGRVYEIIPFVKDNEDPIPTYTMYERSKKMKASAGKEDGQGIFDCQDEIPENAGILVFAEWHCPSGSDCTFLYRDKESGTWVKGYDDLGSNRWGKSCRFVRRANVVCSNCGGK